MTVQEDLFDGATLWKVMTVAEFRQIGGYTLPGRLEMVQRGEGSSYSDDL